MMRCFLFFLLSIATLHTTLSEPPEKIGEICHALITLHLSTFINHITSLLRDEVPNDIDESKYRDLFHNTFERIGLNTVSAFLGGYSLIAKTRKTHFIFQFKVNSTANEALAVLDYYKGRFYEDNKDIVCMGINYHYVRQEREFEQDRLICDWAAKLYDEYGMLKTSFPQRELIYLKRVDLRRESVDHYYDILEEIGRGVSGVVHRCREKKTGNIFAAKIVHVSVDHPDRRKDIRREIDIMSQLHHQNVLNLLNAFEDDDKIVLIVEYLSGGSLDQRRKTSEARAIEFVRQICEAIKYMHARNIFHFNLSLENIMCKTNLCSEIKIIDFGLAVRYDLYVIKAVNSSSSESLEHYFFTEYGFHSDMWAVGVITCLILIGKYPFDGDNTIEITPDSPKYDLSFSDESFRSISGRAKDFLRRLLIKDNRERMTAHESLNHPWLTEGPYKELPYS